MDYNTLVSAKGTPGSIADWVSYSRAQNSLPFILEIAQRHVYQRMRVREMEATFYFTMPVNTASIVLPARFLDPKGIMHTVSDNFDLAYKDEAYVRGYRSFSELTGAFDADPFSTTSGSSIVTVALADSGFTEDSVIYITGATAVGGVTPNGTFRINSVATDGNSFTVDVSDAATSTATGGGASVTYTIDKLNTGTPQTWAIWDGRIHFECAFDTQKNLIQRYYQSLPLLSSSNTTNFLTDRYSHMLLRACSMAAEEFMQEWDAFQIQETQFMALMQDIQEKDDLIYRGAEFLTEMPYGR